jgi:hypothetical protein
MDTASFRAVRAIAGKIEWSRVTRRLAMAPIMFFVGSGFALSAATNAASGDDAGFLRDALLGLVGIIGSLVTLISALVGKREKLVRGDIGDQVKGLHKRVESLDLRVTGHEDWIKAHERQVQDLLRQAHADRLAQQQQIQSLADSVQFMAQELARYGEETREQGKLTMELINLLRRQIDATPGKV